MSTPSARLLSHARTGDGPVSLAHLGDRLWVADRYAGTVAMLDAGSLTVSRRWYVGVSPRALVGVGGAVWVVSGPLREAAHTGGVLTVSNGALVPGDVVGLDPAKMYLRSDTLRALRLVYDGLVTYSVGGNTRGSLVPDLAEAVRARPTAAERTPSGFGAACASPTGRRCWPRTSPAASDAR